MALEHRINPHKHGRGHLTYRVKLEWTIHTCGHSGDVVLVAGKGHEAEQVIGAERRSFSDRAVAAELLGVTS
jgi:UDP-N-acetylmuramyl tripeptide synthase